MIYHYPIPAVPPPANERVKAVPRGMGARLIAAPSVDAWKATAAVHMKRPPGVPLLPGRVVVGLMFRFGSDRRDVDSGIKDALDAMVPVVDKKWGFRLTDSALFDDDRQVVALYVAKDFRKGPVSLDVWVADAAYHAEVARCVMAEADDVLGVRR